MALYERALALHNGNFPKFCMFENLPGFEALVEYYLLAGMVACNNIVPFLLSHYSLFLMSHATENLLPN